MNRTPWMSSCLCVILCGLVTLVSGQGGLAANAGPDQTGKFVGNTITLDGTASLGAVTYNWSFKSRPAKSKAALVNPATPAPTFVADKVGVYVVQLRVGNGVTTSTDTVSITIVNRPPVANAGADVTGAVGLKVRTDGRLSSDPDGDKLSYQWSIVDAPAASARALSGAGSSRPTLVLDRPGSFVLRLTVSDGVASDQDEVTVATTNTAPVANAGPDRHVTAGAVVQLDGTSSSDVDEDSLTFSWSLKKPKGSSAVLDDPTSPTPSFLADRPGTYTATLDVSDGTLSKRDTVTLATAANLKPLAQAGPDEIRLTAGETIQLDASGSTDANAGPLGYAWAVGQRPGGSTASLVGAGPRPEFTADRTGNYRFDLTITDASLAAGKDSRAFKAALPIADAGPDRQVALGGTAVLDGSGSSHTAGGLYYGWSLVVRPAGSAAVLQLPGDPQPRLTPDVDGLYVAQLIVFDGVSLSAADTAVVSTGANLAPHVDLGGDRSIVAGVPAIVDALATDPNGDALSFAWSLLFRPAGSAASLSSAAGLTVSLTPDVAGDYVLQLKATDADGLSAIGTLVLTSGNTRPTVSAGADRAVATGSMVALSAAGADADGGTPSYEWRLLSVPAGSAAVLNDPASATPVFEADVDGVYVAQVMARDGRLYGLDAVVIRASSGDNQKPIADAGPDQSVVTGTLALLDGRGSSDPEGAPLTYAWRLVSQPAGSASILIDPTSDQPSLQIDLPGLYVVELIVNDGVQDSDPDQMSINGNAPPIADAGDDQLVAEGSLVTLDGTGSFDPEGQPITYKWLFNESPVLSTAALDNPLAATPTFTADKPGVYVLQLVVNDGLVNSASDLVRIRTSNTIPVANAGPDQADVAPGSLVHLTGAASSDPDGDPLTYQWLLFSKPPTSTAVLFNATSATPSFQLDRPGVYIVQLVVNDGLVDSAVDSVRISTPNLAPTANAGADRVVPLGNPASLAGSGADPDGDPLTFSWTFVSKPVGSAASLSDPHVASPVFTPDLAGSYTFQLIVNDGFVDSTPDEVIITASLGSVGLALVPSGPVGIARTATVHVTLPVPAPAGGTLVALTSDNPATLSVTTATVSIPAGSSVGNGTVRGEAAGSTFVRATAPGYSEGALSVSVSARFIAPQPTVNAVVTLTTAIPISLSEAAPAGGLTIDVTSADPAVVQVTTPSVVIAAGQSSGTAQVRGLAGGTVAVTFAAPASGFAAGVSQVTVVGQMNIVETSLTITPGFPDTIDVQVLASGSPIAGPAGGINFNLASSNPACVAVPATGSVPAGALQGVATVSYGGTAARPCTTSVTVSIPGFVSDSINVTVNNDPGITVVSGQSGQPFPYSVGAGLQSRVMRFTLGLANHGGRDVQVCSNNTAILKVATSATAASADCAPVHVNDGVTTGDFVVHGVEGQTGATAVTVSAPGFTSQTSGVINVVTPVVQIGGPALGAPPTSITSLAANQIFQVSVGVLNAAGTAFAEYQGVRAGSPGLDIAVTSSNPTAATLFSQTATGGTRVVHLNPGEVASATTISPTSSGIAIDPLTPGSTTITATTPGFGLFPAAGHALTVTATGITIVSGQSGQPFPYSVGAGLQSRVMRFTLGGASHGGRDVQVCSNNTAILKAASSATTAGADCATIHVNDGITNGDFVVHGVEGQTGATSVTVSALGFTSQTSGVINVVTPVVQIGGPTFGAPPTSITSLAANQIFQVSVGVLNAAGTAFVEYQGVRGGTPGLDIVVTSSDPTVATLVSQAGSGGSRTVHLNPGEIATATAITPGSSGLAVDALNPGTTTLTASTAGFGLFPAAGHVLTVTATGITVFSGQSGQPFPYSVGAGLQSRVMRFTLGGASHGGRDVQICSNNTAILKAAGSATAAGADCATIHVNDGITNGDFVVHGVEGQTGATSVTVSALGFTSQTSGVINVVTPVVQIGGPAFGAPPTSITSLAANQIFQVSVGVLNAAGTAFAEYQGVRGGTPGLDIVVTSSDPTIATLVSQAGSGGSRTVHLNPGEFATATTITPGSSGLALDALNPGTTTLTASTAGFGLFPAAGHVLTVTATGITVFSGQSGQPFPYSVGAGLQSRVMRFTLGGASHGGRDVQVCSSNTAILKVATSVAAAGADCAVVHVNDGQTNGDFIAQAIEGQAGGTSVTVTATGFAPTTSGVINVVTPVVQIGGPAFGAPPTSITSLAANQIFQVSVGVLNAAGTAFAEYQGVRGGTPGLDIVVTSSDPTIATLVSQAGSGGSRTVHLNPGEFATATSIAPGNSGLALDALNPGTTTLTANTAGFVLFPTAGHVLTVTATGISVFSGVSGQAFPYNVGAGLQSRVMRFVLGGNQHGGVNVSVCSDDPALLRVAPNGTTVGAACAVVPVAAGATNGDFVVQGLGIGNTVLRVNAPGFSEGVSGTVSVLAPAYQLTGLPASIAQTAANAVFHVAIGPSVFPHTGLAEEQALSPGSVPLSVTVTNSNATAAQLVTASGGAQSWTVSILAGQSRTSASVATGGIALDPLSTGPTTVDSELAGFTKTAAATQGVTVTP